MLLESQDFARIRWRSPACQMPAHRFSPGQGPIHFGLQLHRGVQVGQQPQDVHFLRACDLHPRDHCQSGGASRALHRASVFGRVVVADRHGIQARPERRHPPVQTDACPTRRMETGRYGCACRSQTPSDRPPSAKHPGHKEFRLASKACSGVEMIGMPFLCGSERHVRFRLAYRSPAQSRPIVSCATATTFTCFCMVTQRSPSWLFPITSESMSET